MAWTIDYNQATQKSVRKLDPVIQRRIRDFLHKRLALLPDPRQIGDPLQGTKLGEYWRYKVGDYRIICDIQDKRLVVLVVEIGHRREVYR